MFTDIIRNYHDYLSSKASDGFSWDGVIVAREWPVDMPEEEIALMRVGGRKTRLASPDSASGAPHPTYQLTDYESRQARRLLDANCLNGYEFHNIACNQGRTNILNFLSYATVGANPGYTGIVAFAVGGTQGTPSATDTALFGSNELFRKAITLTTISSSQIDINTNFAANEANYTYGDCGVFGSTSTSIASTTTTNTGILYAHASYVYTKTSSVTLSNDYYISIN